MPLRPWRFQADLAKDEVNPTVTVFVGPERYVMDSNGDPTTDVVVEQSTADPITVQLSELPAMLAAGTVTRATKST